MCLPSYLDGEHIDDQLATKKVHRQAAQDLLSPGGRTGIARQIHGLGALICGTGVCGSLHTQTISQDGLHDVLGAVARWVRATHVLEGEDGDGEEHDVQVLAEELGHVEEGEVLHAHLRRRGRLTRREQGAVVRQQDSGSSQWALIAPGGTWKVGTD